MLGFLKGGIRGREMSGDLDSRSGPATLQHEHGKLGLPVSYL